MSIQWIGIKQTSSIPKKAPNKNTKTGFIDSANPWKFVINPPVRRLIVSKKIKLIDAVRIIKIIPAIPLFITLPRPIRNYLVNLICYL